MHKISESEKKINAQSTCTERGYYQNNLPRNITHNFNLINRYKIYFSRRTKIAEMLKI